VTSTTHKSLRGPRGGIILMKAEHEKAINSAIFPGLQGGPLMHVIAAKAVAFKEAMAPGFKAYQQQVIKNAQTPAASKTKRRASQPTSLPMCSTTHAILPTLKLCASRSMP